MLDARWRGRLPRFGRPASSGCAFQSPRPGLSRFEPWREKADPRKFPYPRKPPRPAKISPPVSSSPVDSSPTGTAFAWQIRALCCGAKNSFAPRFLVGNGCRAWPQLARELRHLNRAKPRFESFVAAFESSAVDRLFQRVTGQHAKNHRDSRVHLRELQTT